MQEAVLAASFEGRATPEEFAADVAGSRVRVTGVMTRTQILDMEGSFVVTREMAIALCDAVLAGALPAAALEVIGFALIASDAFFWDENDDEPADTFWDWSAPEINYALTPENVRMFRDRLGRKPA